MTGREIGGAEGQRGRVALVLATLAVLAVPAVAQTVAGRAADVRDGRIRMAFATRPGVCGHGHNISFSRSTDDWESYCQEGPARVVLTMLRGTLVDVDTYVGGRWRTPRGDVLDLGLVSAPDAARYLMQLARNTRTRAGKDAVFPATIADSIEVWPDLIAVARNHDLPRGTRKAAVFWLGQAAGEAAVGDLTDLVDDDAADLEVRESAIFALSQLRDDEGVEALMQIARSHRDRRIRKKAMFWLGQSDDPRVIALFEEILLRRQ